MPEAKKAKFQKLPGQRERVVMVKDKSIATLSVAPTKNGAYSLRGSVRGEGGKKKAKPVRFATFPEAKAAMEAAQKNAESKGWAVRRSVQISELF